MTANRAALDAREARWQKKIALARSSGKAVVSATLRAPAALRALPEFIAAHARLCGRLERAFADDGCPLARAEAGRDADGPYILWTCPDAIRAKALCAALENEPGGALLDADVLNENGEPLSRAQMGLPPRPCFVCGGDAKICVRARIHDPNEVAFSARAHLKDT